jgi:hypothetical protein
MGSRLRGNDVLRAVFHLKLAALAALGSDPGSSFRGSDPNTSAVASAVKVKQASKKETKK